MVIYSIVLKVLLFVYQEKVKYPDIIQGVNSFQPSSNFVIDKWLESYIRFGRGNWIYRGAKENFEIKKLKGFYDGILFIERSTPVHPTKNALARSESRIGF